MTHVGHRDAADTRLIATGRCAKTGLTATPQGALGSRPAQLGAASQPGRSMSDRLPVGHSKLGRPPEISAHGPLFAACRRNRCVAGLVADNVWRSQNQGTTCKWRRCPS